MHRIVNFIDALEKKSRYFLTLFLRPRNEVSIIGNLYGRNLFYQTF